MTLWALTSILISASNVPSFEAKTLGVDGDMLEVVASDLDGDGKKDLVALYKKGIAPKETRHFAIFWNRGGRYFERPDEVFAAGDDACAFDVADVDAEGGDELLLINPQGVTARSFTGRKISEPVRVVAERTLFPQADSGSLPRLRVVHDLAKEGSRELFLHAPGALDIFKKGDGGYERAAHLEVELESDIKKQGRGRAETRSNNMPTLSVTLRFPAVSVIDTDGDGLSDVVLTLDDRIAVYRQREGMKLASRPTFVRDFAVRTEEDRKESYSWVGVNVVDLDGDGAADLVVRKNVAHGIASAEATNYLYLGRKTGKYPDKPDQVLSNEGAGGAEVELFDITNDGHADLIVPSVNIGIMTIIRWLTSSTLKVNTQVFAFDAKKKRFSEKPVAERELSFNLELKGERDSEAFDMVGDYDGDRLPDLVFATGEEELSIFRGLGAGSLFAEDATAKVAVRGYGEVLSVDLDGKGKSDMVLCYPRTNGHRNELVVLRNITQEPLQTTRN